MSLISRFALFFFTFFLFSSSSSSLYLSPTTLFLGYQKMVNTFKIFVYTLPENPTLNFTSPTATLFYSLLLNSSFITLDPEEAHLFFIPPPLLQPFDAINLTCCRRASRPLPLLESHPRSRPLLDLVFRARPVR